MSMLVSLKSTQDITYKIFFIMALWSSKMPSVQKRKADSIKKIILSFYKEVSRWCYRRVTLFSRNHTSQLEDQNPFPPYRSITVVRLQTAYTVFISLKRKATPLMTGSARILPGSAFPSMPFLCPRQLLLHLNAFSASMRKKHKAWASWSVGRKWAIKLFL